jgi:tetratricopeptide (TPR) repeat protein
MFDGFHSKRRIVYALGLLAVLLCFQSAPAQSDDQTDPVKLFEKGQDAHAKNDLKQAIEFYDAAIKLKPEFPEAELQRSIALVETHRQTEAIEGFKRAVTLRPDWALAYSRFGSELAFFEKNDREAEPILRRAIELDDKDGGALTSLAALRQRAGDLKESLELIRAATLLTNTTPGAIHDIWRRRALIESAAGDLKAAVNSISRAIEILPSFTWDHYLRAQFLLQMNDRAGALSDLDTMRPKFDAELNVAMTIEFAQLYASAGRPEEGLRLLDELKKDDQKLPEVVAVRALLAGDAESSPEARAALEDLLKANPKDASLLARLGSAYRRADPAKSQDYYYRANQIDPTNPKYALGYAAALIQARKFTEAEPILKRVIGNSPDDYTAHANLALALYEMKRFAEAVPEYEWLANAKPEIAATYFFIATAHDNLGEYKQALDAYEKFLAHADPTNNKLEIEKVNLRLPMVLNR